MSLLRGLLNRLARRDAPDEASAKAAAVGAEMSSEGEAAWELKRKATERSSVGDMAGAIAALEAAQRASGEPPAVHDEIRRAKYLQRDGRGAEAWAIYLRLFARPHQWEDVDILDAMRLHLQREGDRDRAALYGVAHRLARADLYRRLKAADEMVLAEPGPSGSDPAFRQRTWELQQSNAQNGIKLAEDWLVELTSSVEVAALTAKLAKKTSLDQAGLMKNTLAALASEVSAREWLRTRGEQSSV